MKNINSFTPRDFMKSAVALSSGTLSLSMIPNKSTGTEMPTEERINVTGARERFSPHVGTLLSSMTW